MSKILKKCQKCRKTGLKPFKISIKRQKRREIGKKVKNIEKTSKMSKNPNKTVKFWKEREKS